jgi:hypothetical protein
MENVDKQYDFLEELLKNQSNKIFVKVEEILDIYHQQSRMLYNNELEAKY